MDELLNKINELNFFYDVVKEQAIENEDSELYDRACTAHELLDILAGIVMEAV